MLTTFQEVQTRLREISRGDMEGDKAFLSTSLWSSSGLSRDSWSILLCLIGITGSRFVVALARVHTVYCDCIHSLIAPLISSFLLMLFKSPNPPLSTPVIYVPSLGDRKLAILVGWALGYFQRLPMNDMILFISLNNKPLGNYLLYWIHPSVDRQQARTRLLQLAPVIL